MTNPTWANKLGKADETTFSKTKTPTFFKLVETQRGNAAVFCKGKIRRGDIAREMLIPLPNSTNERLKLSVMGANAPAIVGLIEWALDELDRQGKTITIEDR